MRTLILGGDGMLGHQLLRHFSANHDVRVTLRQDLPVYARFGLFNESNTYFGIDLCATEQIAKVFAKFRPEVVVNAAGILKRRPESSRPLPNLEINALLPHRLALLCKSNGARLIHMSTDCVFSGKKGNYVESDVLDAEDLYGRSKFLGEVHDRHCITLRTSIIGKELTRKTGLLEWFLSQRGTVKGYKNAIFSGFTTLEFSRLMEKIITGFPNASGLYHVSSQPISKFDLLSRIKDKLRLEIEIVPDYEFRCDRSLESTKFRKEFNYAPPTWDVMLEELAEDIKRNR